MIVNYIDIGLRVKEKRRKIGLTQEKLAELTDMSVSHMSSIENGATKLGLPTIVKVANALETSVDELLCGSLMRGKTVIQNEYVDLLSDCTLDQTMIIVDTIKAMKKSMNQNNADNRIY